MRVSIVGGPGVGKSTLLRQLSDLYHHSAYGEGEEGVWDPNVLEDIDSGRNPVGVTEYFASSTTRTIGTPRSTTGRIASSFSRARESRSRRTWPSIRWRRTPNCGRRSPWEIGG